MSIGPSGSWTPPQGGRPSPPVSTSWRVQHSLWLLVPFIGCCFGGLGLVYVGIRAGRPGWWASGTVYTVLTSVAFFGVAESDPDSNLSLALVFVLIASWVVTIAHSCLVNASWLRWRAAREWARPRTGPGWPTSAYSPGAPLPVQPTPHGHYPPTPLSTTTPPGHPTAAPGYPAPAAIGYPGPSAPGYPAPAAPGYPAPAAPGYPPPAFDPYRVNPARPEDEQAESYGPASDPWSTPAVTSAPLPADPTAAPPVQSSGMTPPPFPPVAGATPPPSPPESSPDSAPR